MYGENYSYGTIKGMVRFTIKDTVIGMVRIMVKGIIGWGRWW